MRQWKSGPEQSCSMVEGYEAHIDLSYIYLLPKRWCGNDPRPSCVSGERITTKKDRTEKNDLYFQIHFFRQYIF